MKYNKMTKLMLKAVITFAFTFLSVLLVMQISHSITFDETGKVIFVPQKAGFIVLRIVIILFVLMLSKRVKLAISKKMFYFIGSAYVLVNIGFVFVLSLYPTYDQYYMTWIASDMIRGGYSQFEPFGYMDLFPFQYSFVRYVKFIFTLFGTDNYYALQILNVIYLWFIIFFVVKNTRFMFGQEQYHVGVIMMFFCPLSFYVTYIYGNMLSLALTLASAYYLQKFLTREGCNWFNFCLIIVLNTFSILIKNNALIFTIAEICVIFLFSIKQADRKAFLRNVFLIVSVLVVYLLSMMAVNRSLSKYTGTDKVGTPKISWIAMGLQTGEFAEGWYNFYNRDVYWDNDCNTELAAELSKASIKTSVSNFIDNPKYCLTFFYKKICSEWTNPSFEALNVIQQSTVNNPNTRIHYSIPARWFLHRSPGKSLDATHFVLNEYLRIYELAIIVGAIIYLMIRRLQVMDCLLIIVFIGGFMFHIIWEAACQYMLAYFVMLIPYGIMGLRDFRDIVTDKAMRKLKSPNMI